ncbi:NUDIX domain-containing protein [Rhizobium leguminosarum]|uniref:NUDIX domain-containing protein n=1 Tax=Rhizobium leguminosarum TaxID=384 RepID=UPI001C94268D|nr:NUDIX domain-containing protein [Rhizobium leguminosarum]MBY5377366.1 NUDIX domain-containing protein [Rhizobium leguminosarum]
MEFKQDQFFQAVASRKIPRIRIAGIVISDGAVLVQQPADDPQSCHAFIGGEYEVGDTFETRLRAEFEEETNANVVEAQYLLCLENHFRYKGNLIQQAEHYYLVKLDRRDIESREAHLKQFWIPLSQFGQANVRPIAVRDAVADGSYMTKRHIVQMPD